MIFLRPWCLLILFIPLLFWKLNKKIDHENPWQKVIDKKLLKALTLAKKIPFSKNTLSKLGLIFWILTSIALAGPAWDKIPVPSAQIKPNTVLVLDLNKSLTPKQIQQIHIKLYDILSLLKEDRVALVLFGQNQGYTAMPLTPDTQLISNIIPSLLPSVLPEDASNIQAGIHEAEKILTQTGNQGRILIISDKKAPVSAFQSISFNPEKDSLVQLSETLNNNHFAPTPTQTDNTADVWYDRGIWLAILALIPACLLFRKNVIFLWLIFGNVSITEAGWFQREDQENYQINQEGISAYRNQNFSKAEENFNKTKHFYNKGNALAYQGKIQEAINAYQEALKINPQDKDAKFNKEYLEKQLQKNENNSNQGQNEQQNQKGSQEQKENNTDNKNQKNDNNSDPLEKQSESENAEQQQQQSSQEDAQKELKQSLAQEQTEEPFNQEEQQILNRLNNDPARVLRYRINLQHQRGSLS